MLHQKDFKFLIIYSLYFKQIKILSFFLPDNMQNFVFSLLIIYKNICYLNSKRNLIFDKYSRYII